MAKKDVKSAAKAAAVAQVNKSSSGSSGSSSTGPAAQSASTVAAIQASIFQELSQSIKISYKTYTKDLQNDSTLQLIDYFLVFLVALGVLQFCYCVLIGSFPFNAFLGGFISTVGQFVLTVSLRLQTYNPKTFPTITKERAIGDFVFSSLVLHFIVYHFIN